MAGFLASTIRRWASEPCEPRPCGLDVWRYACECAGRHWHPLPEHQDRRSMVGLLRAEGGLEAYAGSLIEPLGWRRTSSPGKGDVGVVHFEGLGKACAIRLDQRWMARGDRRAVLAVPSLIFAAWSLEKCPQP